MTYWIEISPRAYVDIAEIHQWLIEVADTDVADDYLGRLLVQIRTLDRFPNRGTPRPDIGRDVRSFSFERSLIVGYRVRADLVRIERVVSGKRLLKGLF